MQTFTLDDLAFLGSGLVRPECVLTTASGRLYVSDARGGVSVVEPDGRSTLIAATAEAADGPVHPNGIALDGDGSFLLAHLGPQTGGVYRLGRDGSLRPVLMEVDGARLPPTNFVYLDRNRRMWVTVSTRLSPRGLAYREDHADGFIVLDDGKGPRIVAEGIGYSNECKVHPSGDWLYVNETFARRLSRFPLRADGSLGARETVAEFGPGSFPDGVELDGAGGAWVTCVVSNRLIYVSPSGAQTIVLEDSDPEFVAECVAKYEARTLRSEDLAVVRSRRLGNIASLAFGGPDLRTAYLGCLLGDSLAVLRLPVAGMEPVHWQWG